MRTVVRVEDQPSVLAQWQGACAEIWIFDLTFRRLALLPTNAEVNDILYVTGIGCRYITGPFRWDNVRLSIAPSDARRSNITLTSSRASLASVRLTRWASHAIPEFMRMVELRLLLALILVLLGGTVIIDLNLGNDADTMTLQGRTQPLRVNLEEKTLTSVGRPSPALDAPRTNSDIAPRSCVSVIDLACVLRC